MFCCEQNKLKGSLRLWVYLAVMKGPTFLPSEELDVVLPTLKERGFEEKQTGGMALAICTSFNNICAEP